MTDFSDTYRHRRVLVTGHTGFKGSWLVLWLDSMGAQIAGIALDPNTDPNHWESLALPIHQTRLDIREPQKLASFVREFQPEIVFHLAAQPLVRASYVDPLGTWSTNVMGTANLLEACRHVSPLRAIVVATTDKCYENREWDWGYRETDRLGGHDPYSASKACAELVAASFRTSFFSDANAPLLATARAGNVVGGGDWSVDRLIPNLVRSAIAGNPLIVRSPRATRPWQHVLDSLSGYLLLGQKLLDGGRQFASAWNFGPNDPRPYTVADVLRTMAQHWPRLDWQASTTTNPPEATSLRLDSSKARGGLGWKPTWDLEQTLRATADWYQAFVTRGEVASRAQLQRYLAAAST